MRKFTGTALIVLAVLFLVSPGNLLAADATIIKIFKAEGPKGEVSLAPPDLYITKNTVVIWMNGIEGKEVKVVFEDGKACKDVSFSPSQKGFGLDATTCYVTSFIPYASTSSLKFTDVGTFEYQVLTQDAKTGIKGKIIVRDL
jgi:hypothetical protein